MGGHGGRPRGRQIRALVVALALLALVPAGAAALDPAGHPADLARLTDGAGASAVGPGTPAEIEAGVLAAFEDDTRVPVIVRLRDQVDLAGAGGCGRARWAARRGQAARVRTVVEELQEKAAERRRPAVRDLLRAEETAGRARRRPLLLDLQRLQPRRS